MKTTRILTLLALLLVAGGTMKAQLRIDWQQCYGGLGFDEPAGFASTNNGFIIEGWSELGSGMVSCGTQGIKGTWTIRIDENLNIINQDCNQDCRYHGIFKDVSVQNAIGRISSAVSSSCVVLARLIDKAPP